MRTFAFRTGPAPEPPLVVRAPPAQVAQPHLRAMETRDAGVARGVSHDFSRIPVHHAAHGTIQRDPRVHTPAGVRALQANHVAQLLEGMAGPPAGVPLVETLRRAGTEPAAPLDPVVRERMETRLGQDLGRVRVHAGPASAQAADRMGARAYTLGRDIHLGSEGRAAAGEARERLLAHEAVHTLQQGGRSVAPGPGMRVAAASDPAEAEARRVAGEAASREGTDPAGAPAAVSALAEPAIQRDLNKSFVVKDGTFKLALATVSAPGAKSGMKGTIGFTAGKDAPDSTSIRLVQTVRNEDLTTGKDYVWAAGGPSAAINAMQTTADAKAGITGGVSVDHLPSTVSPRTAKADPAVSIYYRDYAPNPADSQDGSKAGATVKEASLWDFPGWNQKMRWTFETVARGVDTGYIFAAVRWGFTLSDPATGKVENEHAAAYRGASATYREAVKQFNEYYKNPGASTAP